MYNEIVVVWKQVGDEQLAMTLYNTKTKVLKDWNSENGSYEPRILAVEGEIVNEKTTVA